MKYFFKIFLATITLIIFWINVKLYSENYTKPAVQKDIISQLNFLETELKTNNAGLKMQEIFPEGIVFINVLYGLSWAELANSDKKIDPKIKLKALNEAIYAYNQTDSDIVKSRFQKHLIPEYGVFYFGWKNYLLSKILQIDTTFENYLLYKREYVNNCIYLNDQIARFDTPYFESYSNQCWPADMFVAMASFANHDKIFKPKYAREINQWLAKVKGNLNIENQMIAHKVNTNFGGVLQKSRGSSLSLIIRMLSEIDKDFALQQYQLFERNFISSTFGLPSINEFPYGVVGNADIDSGPVILGVGFSATIVSIGTISIFDKNNLSDNLYKTINAFGFGNNYNNQKRYLFGKLPIADAFIAWGRATNLINANSYKSDFNFYFFKFHIISIFVIMVIWLLFLWKK